jgi:toxin ParE1/3/4
MIPQNYKIDLSPMALIHLQDAIDYYNECAKGLGRRFYNHFVIAKKKLQLSPHHQIQYHNIRCIMIPKFPFRIHFEVDDTLKRVYILAVIHTSKNPDTAWIKY